MELGIYSFAEIENQTPAERLRDLLEEIELADELGLDVFGIGEHPTGPTSRSPRRWSSSPQRRSARSASA